MSTSPVTPVQLCQNTATISNYLIDGSLFHQALSFRCENPSTRVAITPSYTVRLCEPCFQKLLLR
jgi:hypothetical protein